ncbi:MAG: 1,4-dihydroxy-2-naphthoate octaprenyltransferase [Bacteroidales bacterium]|nr:1,4-dihydroxy-2-naphthoate octaprenyltransferase [Bacteroidales bacterium]
MNKVKAIISSLRLRTLPLSLAGIVMGIFLAVADYRVKPLSIVFLVLTAVFLQILANLSNELGDVLKGTDTELRQGPQYGLNGGGLSISEMKILVGVFVGLSAVSGVLMIAFSAFGSLFSIEGLCFLMLLVAAIGAAMRYTLGRNPYGYRALGDIYVFLFFGLATVLGGYFLCAGEIADAKLLLPAACIGLFSVGVLNVNNIRDAKTDSATRRTVAILLGPKWSRVYQTALIIAGWACALIYCSLRMTDIWNYLFVVTAPLFIIHLLMVWKRQDKALDPALPILVTSSFLFACLMGFGFIHFLL